MLDTSTGVALTRPRALSCAAAGALFLGAAAHFGVAAASAGQAADSASVRVGPGPVSRTFSRESHILAVGIRPNRAAVWNTVTLTILRRGAPVRGAQVRLSFDMRSMEMGTQTFTLAEAHPGVYTYFGPVLVMLGRWDLTFRITPQGGRRFTTLVVDRVAH